MTFDLTHDLPQIDADQFVLRPLRPEDEGLITLYAADERVARMTTSIPHPLPPGAAASLIKRAQASDRTEHFWAMDASGSGGASLMGLISLDTVHPSQAEIGYWVAPAFWGTHTASCAVTALLDTNPLGCETIFAAVFKDNPASAKVLTNAGFKYLGDAEGFCVARDAAVPTWTYSRRMTGA